MNYSKKLLFQFSLLCVLLMAGCKKEDPFETNTDLLQDKKWKLTAETTDGKNTMTDYEACDLDDFITYQKGGNAIHDAGAKKCLATDPQTETVGTWTLSADGKTIAVKESGFTLDFKIVELTSTTLKTEVSLLGLATLVQTYTKQ